MKELRIDHIPHPQPWVRSSSTYSPLKVWESLTLSRSSIFGSLAYAVEGSERELGPQRNPIFPMNVGVGDDAFTFRFIHSTVYSVEHINCGEVDLVPHKAKLLEQAFLPPFTDV